MKILFSVFIFILLLFPLSSHAVAKDNIKSEESSVLPKEQVVNADYFTAGEKVVLSGTVNGDVYAAGGDITLDGVVNGDVLVAGGNVEIAGVVNGNIRSAGGSINIRGVVDKNITALGGSIIFHKEATVRGSLVSAGGNIDISSPIGKGITVAGGNMSVSNSVGGTIDAAVGQLSLESGAMVNGDLNYWSDEELFQAEDSTVSGKIVHNIPPVSEASREQMPEGANFGFTIFTFLTTFLIGSILLYFFPHFTQRVTDQIVKNPGMTFLIGLLFLIVVPIVCILLMITLIGIPLGVLLLIFYIYLLLFGHLFSGLTLGKWASKKLNFSANAYVALAVGLAALYLLEFIPLVGWVVGFVASIFGVGAYVMTKKQFFTELKAKL